MKFYELVEPWRNDYAQNRLAPNKERVYLNEEETIELVCLPAKVPIQYKTMTLLLIYTGMGRSELMWLEWKDIDFESKTIRIVRTSAHHRLQMVSSPKNRKRNPVFGH